jgi:hypothetical protein
MKLCLLCFCVPYIEVMVLLRARNVETRCFVGLITKGRGISELKKDFATLDRLCDLVVRVIGYRSGGPGSIPGTTKKK